MPFGSEASSAPPRNSRNVARWLRSPMPFGSEASWATLALLIAAGIDSLGHQCLSAVRPLGPRTVVPATHHGLVPSPMPFGSEASWARPTRPRGQG